MLRVTQYVKEKKGQDKSMETKQRIRRIHRKAIAEVRENTRQGKRKTVFINAKDRKYQIKHRKFCIVKNVA